MTLLPPKNDNRWREVAVGKRTATYSLLAVKIMMSRVLKETKADPSPDNIASRAGEVYDFFAKNQKVAANDIAALFPGNR